MAKYPELTQKIDECIKRGDFTLSGFPSERRLAEIYEVSRMTARRTIQCLIDRGVLLRSESGRISINSSEDSAVDTQIAFLAPASYSYFVHNMRVCAERLAPQYNMHIRAIDYVSWEDPVFNDALSNFSAIFISGTGSHPEDEVVKKIQECGKPVVAVEGDLSAYGIPSILLYSNQCVKVLLDYFHDMGHKEIDCFNTLPSTIEVIKRIDCWREWLKRNHLSGRLINKPGGKSPDTLDESYELMNGYLKDASRSASAVFFTGSVSAIGALRAVHDCGLQAGVDISAGSLGGDGLYRYLTPALTSIEQLDPTAFFVKSLKWFSKPGTKWKGELLMSPTEHPVFTGETCADLR